MPRDEMNMSLQVATEYIVAALDRQRDDAVQMSRESNDAAQTRHEETLAHLRERDDKQAKGDVAFYQEQVDTLIHQLDEMSTMCLRLQRELDAARKGTDRG